MKKGPLFLIALLVLAADQATKYLIKGSLSPEEVIPVLPFFDIVYVENTGSAFGMFKSLGNIFFVSVSVIAMAAVSFFMVKGKEDGLGLSLVLGGAAGNMLDRLFRGYVVDFLDIHAGGAHWPAFNVADSALCIGVILILARSLFPKKAS